MPEDFLSALQTVRIGCNFRPDVSFGESELEAGPLENAGHEPPPYGLKAVRLVVLV